MKIYKTIKSDELQQHTQNGWTWDTTPLREQRITEHRDTLGREPNAEERQRGCYSRVYDPSQPFFGDVLIFVVWKEEETITREQELARLAEERRTQAWELTEQVKTLTTGAKELADRLNIAEQQVLDKQKIAERAGAAQQKLERDIAKIRSAIGELKMQEILK